MKLAGVVAGILAVILAQGCSNSGVGTTTASPEYVEYPVNRQSCAYCLGSGNMGDPISACGWCRGTGLKPQGLALAEWPPLAKKSSSRVVER